MFVRAAHRSHAKLAGYKVLRIGSMTPEQAYAKVRELVGRDNEMDARFFGPFLLAMPEILHALRITTSPEEATFVLELGGKRETVTLRSVGPASMMPPDTEQLVAGQRLARHAGPGFDSSALAEREPQYQVLGPISARGSASLRSVQSSREHGE